MTYRVDLKEEHMNITRKVVTDYIGQRVRELDEMGRPLMLSELARLLGEISGDTLARAGVRHCRPDAPAAACYLLSTSAQTTIMRSPFTKNTKKEYCCA